MAYHVPVLLQESIDALVANKDGIYVDATFGGGGHSKVILDTISAKGHLYAFDQDSDVLENLISENEHFTFIQHNFRFLKRFLRLHGVRQVDGILADLGVSSHQLDSPERGFSHRFDTELDMRMNRDGGTTAAQLINTERAERLQQLFSDYGEVRNARSLANAIVEARRLKEIRTVGELIMVMEPLIRGNRQRYLSQVFQALRIEVNEEMQALTDFLEGALEVLRPGGRLVVISYHSLEDRLVKRFLKSGNVDGTVVKDFYGNIDRPFKLITRKSVMASDEEVRQNPRARSARLRVAEKI
ncbi:MAG: 16S rRNA (cytosine(1402)-N(4))-methyltransferase RsmH [Bacteroidota bacterium]